MAKTRVFIAAVLFMSMAGQAASQTFDAGRLVDLVSAAAGCQVVATRVVDPNDKATWSAQYDDACTAPQRAAGDAAIAGFDLAAWKAAQRPVNVPARVANWQGQAILVQRGIYDAASAAIDALPDPVQRQVAQIAFRSADFTRASPLMNQLLKAPPIGYTDEQIDQLFIDAAKLAM